MYDIIFSPRAKADIVKLKRDEPNAYKKAVKLVNELMDHPRTGTGKPEQLTGDRAGQWSRRITQTHRLIYEIFDTEGHVDVISAYGHYENK